MAAMKAKQFEEDAAVKVHRIRITLTSRNVKNLEKGMQPPPPLSHCVELLSRMPPMRPRRLLFFLARLARHLCRRATGRLRTHTAPHVFFVQRRSDAHGRLCCPLSPSLYFLRSLLGPDQGRQG